MILQKGTKFVGFFHAVDTNAESETVGTQQIVVDFF